MCDVGDSVEIFSRIPTFLEDTARKTKNQSNYVLIDS
jgi:hypothetical protein